MSCCHIYFRLKAKMPKLGSQVTFDTDDLDFFWLTGFVVWSWFGLCLISVLVGGFNLPIRIRSELTVRGKHWFYWGTKCKHKSTQTLNSSAEKFTQSPWTHTELRGNARPQFKRLSGYWGDTRSISSIGNWGVPDVYDDEV